MRKRWDKLKRDVRGAVTVFVTLLLIPAVLVSGTGVDLARLYVARSVLHDANQLAANAALTQYDALLQDLYGLFGICRTDPELGEMIDRYIQVTVFGEDWKDTSLGTFQLFYGSDLVSSGMTTVTGQNLGEPDVLRRQIEEYAKLRAPVIIVEKILKTIDKFKTIKQDADAIQTKMDLDKRVDEIDKLYKELYEKLKEFNKFEKDVSDRFSNVNKGLEKVSKQLKVMDKLQGDYRDECRNSEPDEEKLGDMKLHYDGVLKNVRVLMDGGNLNEGWSGGGYNSNGNWESGHWGTTENIATDMGVKKLASDGKKAMDDYEKQYKAIRDLCVKIESKKGELSAKVDELESKLADCSEGLQDGMTKKDDKGYSVIDYYRLLLKDDTVAMADAMIEKDKPVIETVRTEFDTLYFGDQNKGKEIGLTITHMEHLTDVSVGFSIEALEQDLISELPADKRLNTYALETNYKYKTSYGFKKFQDVNQKNKEFYSLLASMYEEGTAAEEAKKNMKQIGESLYKAAQQAQKGVEFYVTDGANYYLSKASKDEEMQSVYGQEGNWDSEGVGEEKTEEALNSDIVSKIGDLAGAIADKALLLTYDVSMFSCFTTKENTKSMAGIPMDRNVNYFYHSEQEYLFTGSNVAAVNLAAVAGLLLLVRFVFNYIASFTIEDVCMVVDSIKAALSFLGPLGILIAEAVRAAIAMGESAIDVIRLRSGKEVAVLKIGKDAEDWRLSLQGLLDCIADAAEDAAEAAAEAVNENAKEASEYDAGDLSEGLTTLRYEDYMTLFLLIQPADNLADRTRNLIQFNTTNYSKKLKADEEKMAKTPLIDLSTMTTGFSITTTVDLRMLFLSMPFAQKGIDGTVPPGKVALKVTDYRGY